LILKKLKFSYPELGLIKRSGQVVSSDSASPSSRSKSAKFRSNSKPNFVSYKYRSPIVYRASYSLPAQVHNGISLQFDWSTFSWYYATRGYYRKSIQKSSNLSLSNPKFSGRVFDFESGTWRYELREKSNKKKRANNLYEFPVVARSSNINESIQLDDGYVNPVTGEFFPNKTRVRDKEL
jgi:hypothetical protein